MATSPLSARSPTMAALSGRTAGSTARPAKRAEISCAQSSRGRRNRPRSAGGQKQRKSRSHARKPPILRPKLHLYQLVMVKDGSPENNVISTTDQRKTHGPQG